MAVVHDPMIACVDSLAANIKALHAVEEKMAIVDENWKYLFQEGKCEHLTVDSDDFDNFGLQEVDFARVELTQADAKTIAEAEELDDLSAFWSVLAAQQIALRAACRDGVESAQSDADKAESRRHDYSTFAREWLGALAEQDVLDALLDAEDD